MDQSHAPYFEALCAYAQVDRAAFHTPGHLQGKGAHPVMRAAVAVNAR